LTIRVEGVVLLVGKAGEGVGFPDVLVSDGRSVVATDAQGRFVLPETEPGHPVFIVTPAGYRPLHDFYRHPAPGVPMTFRLAQAPQRARARYTFVLLADYQWEPDESMHAVFRRLVSDPACPQFIAHVGDLFYMMEGAPVHVARRYYEAYRDALRGVDLPVFNLIGNHDQVNGPPVSPEMPEFADGLYRETLGPTYYAFDWGDVHYVALNSFEIVGKTQHSRFSDRQLSWLEEDLGHQPPDKPLILFAHRPPMQMENEDDLLNVLEGWRVLACFAGDWHRDAVFRCPGEPFPTIITVGPMENIHWMPAGYRIVEVDGSRVHHVYRLLHSLDEVHIVRPVPGSQVAGEVEIVITEHTWSGRGTRPAFSVNSGSWTPFRCQPLPGNRTAGCQATWAQWRTRWQASKGATLVIRAADDATPEAHLSLSLSVTASPVVWRKPVAQSRDMLWRSQPVVVGDRVIVGEDTGVRAFLTSDGTVVWAYEESARWLGTPALADDRVVVTSWEGDVVALDHLEGRPLWRTRQVCAPPPAQPCVAGGFVVIGGMKRDGIWDGSLTCLSLADGAVMWFRRYERPFFSTPLYAAGRLWASCGDVVHCIDVAQGRDVWTFHPEHFSLYGRMAMVSGQLVAPDGDGWTYVLNPRTGQLITRVLLPRGTGFATDGATLYAACGMRGLRAYEGTTLEKLWRVHRPGTYFAGYPVLWQEALIAAGSDGNIYVFEKHSGRKTWSFQLGDVGGATPAVDEERGYTITGGGELVAFRLPV
jgi:outer membrane protein assembly factor BamB